MKKYLGFVLIVLFLSGCLKEDGKLKIVVFEPSSIFPKISKNAEIYIDGIKKASSMGGSVQFEIEEGKHNLKVIHKTKYYTYNYEKNIDINAKVSIDMPIYFKSHTQIIENDNIHLIKELFDKLHTQYMQIKKLQEEKNLSKAKKEFIKLKKNYTNTLDDLDNKTYFIKHLENSDYPTVKMLNKEISKINIQLSKPVGIGYLYPLDTFIVNLKSDTGRKSLKVSMSLELSNEKSSLELDAKISIIRKKIIKILTSKTLKELSSKKGKLKVSEQILNTLNSTITDEHIWNLYFTEFVIE